jgi:hypothetical protein
MATEHNDNRRLRLSDSDSYKHSDRDTNAFGNGDCNGNGKSNGKGKGKGNDAGTSKAASKPPVDGRPKRMSNGVKITVEATRYTATATVVPMPFLKLARRTGSPSLA